MYRFCGMCGAALRAESPEELANQEVPVSAPASATASGARKSISQAPAVAERPTVDRQPPTVSRDLSYLLEDDDAPPPSHGRMYLALAILVLSGILLGWHWHRDGYPWSSPAQPASVTTAAPVSQPAAAAPAPSRTPAVTQPPVEKPKTPPAETAATPAEAQARQPANPAAPEPKATPAETAAATPSAETPAPEAPQPAVSNPVKPADAAAPAPAAPAMSRDDKLVADGEKYLYGNGVKENCALAQKDLRSAADRSNARAQTLLGAMYATGHCVSRDLPSAYRWFAKALHNDPGNGRIQADLEMVWKQMTPGERQVATRSQ